MSASGRGSGSGGGTAFRRTKVRYPTKVDAHHLDDKYRGPARHAQVIRSQQTDHLTVSTDHPGAPTRESLGN